jgi:hypothetical protein
MSYELLFRFTAPYPDEDFTLSAAPHSFPVFMDGIKLASVPYIDVTELNFLEAYFVI